ncbi:MAG: lipase maturation factor family protein, partial [Gammaproteobacteria bacterium]|nr:lipase maturation factor family protein [Gammaproteobacteria bacterium]
TALAWYAHQLPAALLEWSVWLTFVIELALPFLIFFPRNLRFVAAGGFVLLEVLIFATGNYNFFNILTIVLCIALLDDQWIKPIVRGVTASPGRKLSKTFAGAIMALGILVTFHNVFRLPGPMAALTEAAAPMRIANPYGLFAVMTTRRDELVVEGSMDGHTWSPYVFPFKPDDVAAPPRWATPHQPRLDWQMWFAALTTPEGAPWTYDFVFALLEARPDVLKLVADPFDGARPKFVRIMRHRYRFSTPAEKSSTGDWWVRGDATTWLPPTQLRRPKITHEPLTLD